MTTLIVPVLEECPHCPARIRITEPSTGVDLMLVRPDTEPPAGAELLEETIERACPGDCPQTWRYRIYRLSA